MIKIKYGNIELKGDSFDLLTEATLVTSEIIKIASDGDNEYAEAFLYATIKGVIKILTQNGINIDAELIRTALADSTD